MIHNRTEENRQDRTDTPEVRPDERTDISPYISRRPAWADRVTIGSEAIDYSWTAPTVPGVIETDGGTYPVQVMITREDMLYVNEEGVVLDPGPERIFLVDATFTIENARKLAAAIVECCDRINSTLAVDQ